MKNSALYGCIFLVMLLYTACHHPDPLTRNSQKERSGGPCDGCELMYAGIPEKIGAVDTSGGWTEGGQRLLLRGRICKPGTTEPLPGVIIYYWHTDHKGYYSSGKNTPAAAARHGHLRGWLRSDPNGFFSLHTCRPAPYPGDSIPAHIHMLLKEPGMNEYYIDDLVFDDDPLLTPGKRRSMELRGGSGILQLQMQNGVAVATHTIEAGKNIPGHQER